MNKELNAVIKKNLQPLRGEKSDYDSIVEMAKNSRFVLIGESSHGTKEFYKIRADITKRLIDELDFNAVAIEGDWPDAYRVNRYVNATNSNGGATQALEDFERFPTWMWQNREVLSFIKWLRCYNTVNSKAAVGFYGLDLYSMNSSVAAVISYLDEVDPEAATRARLHYNCLDNFPATSSSVLQALDKSCKEEILQQLEELYQNSFEYLKKDGFVAQEELFCATQNAELVKSAQSYYHSLYLSEESSWNLRDTHMARTVEKLESHLKETRKKPAKIVIWAHNSHIGDARATDMSRRGELNLGQIMREKYKDETLLIGFSTYQGKVSAASNWDMPVEHKTVIPALKGSVEEALHETGVKDFILKFRGNEQLTKALDTPLLERFIGVIYQPRTERQSHYYHAHISRQFDALIYLDETTAVQPLKTETHWVKNDLDETFPFGI